MNLIDCDDNRSYSKESIAELAENIGAVAQNTGGCGLISPIALVRNEKRFRVIAGRRRFRAMQYRKVKELSDDAYIILENVNESLIAFSENFHRQDLTLAEEVEQLRALQGENMTVSELSALIGKTPRWVAMRLNLTQLTGEWTVVLEKHDEYPQWTPRLLEEVAKYPPEVQEKLTSCIDEAYSLEDLRRSLEQDHERDMNQACFDQTDCESCQKRSRCELLLFDEDNNLCLDPECFNRKTADFVLAEYNRLKEEKADIYIIETGYPGYNSPLRELHNIAVHASEESIAGAGQANAFIVAGEKAGHYVHYEPKDKNYAERYKVCFLEQEISETGEKAKKVKTLADREQELKGKRIRVAIGLMQTYLKAEDSFEKICALNPDYAVKFLSLGMVFSISSVDGYVYNVEEACAEYTEYIKADKDNFLRHCWKSIANSISSRIGNVLGATLDHIDDKDITFYCKLLNLNYQELFFSPASDQVKEPKSLIQAREAAEAEKADKKKK